LAKSEKQKRKEYYRRKKLEKIKELETQERELRKEVKLLGEENNALRLIASNLRKLLKMYPGYEDRIKPIVDEIFYERTQMFNKKKSMLTTKKSQIGILKNKSNEKLSLNMKLFGKKVSELNEDELREYNRIRQSIRNEKLREGG
jgi:hypothetical protein